MPSDGASAGTRARAQVKYAFGGEHSALRALSADPADLSAAAAGLTLLPLVSTFALSLLYHTFMSHRACCERASPRAYEALLCVDVAGVVAALSLSWVAPLLFGFWRSTRLLALFGGLHAARALPPPFPLTRAGAPSCRASPPTRHPPGVALTPAMLPLSPQAATAAGFAATRSTDQTARVLPLGLLLLSHYVGLGARIAGVGEPCAAATRQYLWSELLLLAGGVCNALFLPERFFPGKLDFVLNSHQLMHLSTLAATPFLFAGVLADHKCYAAL